MKQFTSFIFCCLFVFTLRAQPDPVYFPVRVKQHWGLIDIKGKVVVKPVWYSRPYYIGQGLFSVFDTISGSDLSIDLRGRIHDTIHNFFIPWSKKDGPGYIRDKGFTDERGNIIIPDTFQIVYPFKDGYAGVVSKTTEGYGFIDRNGKTAIPMIYSFRLDEEVNDGLVRYDFTGFLNTKGDTVIPADLYDDAHLFSQGLAAVSKNDRWNYIFKTGELLSRYWYLEARDFSEGLAFVRDETGMYYINTKGEKVITLDTTIFDYVHDFKENLALVWFKKTGSGFINRKGEVVIRGNFSCESDFSEGYAVVADEKGFYFIDQTGKALTQQRFSDAVPFGNGLAPVFTGEHAGQQITGCVVDGSYGRFMQGKYASRDLKMGYLNKQGKLVWQPTE